MSHLTMLFSRSKELSFTVVRNGVPCVLGKDEALEYFDTEFLVNVMTDHQEILRGLTTARAQFLETVKIRRNVPAADPLRRDVRVDQVTVDGEMVEMYAGRGDRYVEALVDRRFPDPPASEIPDFASFWSKGCKLQPVWAVEIITADDVQSIDLGPAQRSGRQLPVGVAMKQLDRLEADGWRLVQVSEDRAIEVSAEGSDEASVVRARYLMTRP